MNTMKLGVKDMITEMKTEDNTNTNLSEKQLLDENKVSEWTLSRTKDQI